MAQEKYLSPAEKVELIKSQKSSVLLSAFESYARRNPIIPPEEMELIRAELLIRLADASELEEAPEKEITSEETQKPTESKSEPSDKWKRSAFSVFFSKNQILDELYRLRSDLSTGDHVGCIKRHQHQMNRFIKAIDVAIEVLKEETK